MNHRIYQINILKVNEKNSHSYAQSTVRKDLRRHSKQVLPSGSDNVNMWPLLFCQVRFGKQTGGTDDGC